MTRLSCLFAVFLALNSSFAKAASSKPSGKATSKNSKIRKSKSSRGVRQLFEEAQKLFDAGKFVEALYAFDAILRKYPSHEPSQLQLAKTLYRLDKYKEAYVMFGRLKVEFLDPESAYEYGYSFYQQKEWEGALAGFKVVPKDHALADLANYYGAVCAIKLRRYDEASDMLEKALVLPDKLSKSRALYIKHLQALTLISQKSALAKEREAELQRLTDLKRTQKEKMKESAKDKSISPPAPAELPPSGPYEHKGSMGISKKASLSYLDQHQTIENHGYRSTTFEAKRASFLISSGSTFPIPMKIKERNAGFGFQLDLGASSTIKKGREERFLIETDNEDLTRVKAQVIEERELQMGSVGGNIWTDFPLPEESWLALGASLSFDYPEFKRGRRYGDRRGFIQVSNLASPISLQTEISYSELLNEKTEPHTSIVGGRVTLSSSYFGSLGLSSTLEHRIFDYLIEGVELEGPDSHTHLEISANQSFLYGISVALVGDVAQQLNYIHYGIPTYGTTASDGVTLSGQAILSAAPFPWIRFSLTESIAKTEWQPDNPAAQETFELNVADYIESLNAVVSVNLAF